MSPQQLSLFDVLAAPPRATGRILIAAGALAAEALLLERLDGLLAEVRRDPALLRTPVRIVVPSRSLRLHVAAALVRRRGRSVAGVSVQTLFGLASEILERAGETAPRGGGLLDVFAQRAARAEPSLRRGLEDLADGFAAVTGTVRDLLDAGLEPVHAEAAEEALASDGPFVASPADVARARALVRSAAGAEGAMRAMGLGRASTLLRRAAELVDAGDEEVLPARALLIHGFADATGVATDLIEALLRKRGAVLILDHPPKPEREGGVEREFTARFAERLGHSSDVETAPPPSDAGPDLAAREAVGADAESREVASRIRALIDVGERPEGIGVVSRDLDPYRFALRRHFDRLGIPFSGVGERGGLEPAGRRARALLELLRDGETVPSDRWLDALAGLPEERHSPALPEGRGNGWVDLRLALAALGAGRLRDATELRLEEVLRKGSYALPIRQGLQKVGEEDETSEELEEGARSNEAHARKRKIQGALIRAAVRAAKRTRERLAAWPDEAPAAEHLARLRSLLTADLGWDLDAEESRAVRGALEEFEREVPARFRLERDEMRLLVEALLAAAGGSAVGGQGGGVQVLSVTEARARTFDHLFLIGLNRDVFPRGIREDPLLPDDLRRILQRVLPDVPIKRAGFDEERYLFAQLLSAAPAVTLSWQTADDDGKPLPASPLVERLRERLEVEKAPPLWSLPKSGPLPGPRTAAEHAVMAGLHAPRRWWGRVMRMALQESRAELADARARQGGDRAQQAAPLQIFDLSPERLATGRLAVLEEMDPDLRLPDGRTTRARLGPYFGFIGRIPSGGEGEPRLRDLYVTQLENLAACPWQLFLLRLLRIEPTPDPLGALPGVNPLLLGNVVHGALDKIARPPGREGTRGGLRRLDPLAVAWPEDREVEQLLFEEANRLLGEEGIFLPGLGRALAELARPMLETARDLDWGGGAVPVLATEFEGELDVGDAAGPLRQVLFKADRVDRDAGGLVIWTDYKTGRPISEARRPEVRRSHFLARVRKGSHLQAVAYLLGSEGESRGRYLYLRPGIPDSGRELAVTNADREFTEAFVEASEAVLAAWEAGSFFPRLVELDGRKEPGRCGFCAVSEACLRYDSGARQRLFEWTERSLAVPAPEEQALLRVWRLGAKAAEDPRPDPHPLAPSPFSSRLPAQGEGEKSDGVREREGNVVDFSPLSRGGRPRGGGRGAGGEGPGGGGSA
ncbi:MAG TPA: PD-(D/E)XK nuclease family protein [Thermoanaerobaculia bacterium]|nr:PD-(D/E)XK nuclease family protein [Thermoanaerobaculia bacterium]